MANAIIIYPNSREEVNLYRQLAKQLNNRFVTGKNMAPAKEKKILDDLSDSIREMKLHQEGKLKLKTIEEVIDEL